MLVALLLSSYRCIVTINVLWLYLTVRWVGLQCVIVVFRDDTHLRFTIPLIKCFTILIILKLQPGKKSKV